MKKPHGNTGKRNAAKSDPRTRIVSVRVPDDVYADLVAAGNLCGKSPHQMAGEWLASFDSRPALFKKLMPAVHASTNNRPIHSIFCFDGIAGMLPLLTPYTLACAVAAFHPCVIQPAIYPCPYGPPKLPFPPL